MLSRSQDASPEEIAKTRAHLNCALQAVYCSRQFGDEIIEKNWEDFTEQDLELNPEQWISCGRLYKTAFSGKGKIPVGLCDESGDDKTGTGEKGTAIICRSFYGNVFLL